MLWLKHGGKPTLKGRYIYIYIYIHNRSPRWPYAWYILGPAPKQDTVVKVGVLFHKKLEYIIHPLLMFWQPPRQCCVYKYIYTWEHYLIWFRVTYHPLSEANKNRLIGEASLNKLKLHEITCSKTTRSHEFMMRFGISDISLIRLQVSNTAGMHSHSTTRPQLVLSLNRTLVIWIKHDCHSYSNHESVWLFWTSHMSSFPYWDFESF